VTKLRIKRKSFRFSGARRYSIAAALLLPLIAALAAAEDNAGNCLGIGFDVTHPVTIAKIIADRPQVHFIKSALDDAACPAEGDTCAQPSYVIPGDLVLVGKTRGVSYQSAADRTQRWTVGWLPSASLTPVQPTRAPVTGDWMGRWSHAGGTITISRGRRGTLRIRGEHVYPAAQEVHSGVISADAKPAQGLLQFADDGSVRFDRDSAESGSCLVRMQRIAELLVVEDNDHCGWVDGDFHRILPAQGAEQELSEIQPSASSDFGRLNDWSSFGRGSNFAGAPEPKHFIFAA
jgi:hypothetical protein